MRKSLLPSSALLLLAVALAFVNERSRSDDGRKTSDGSGSDAGPPFESLMRRHTSSADEVDSVRSKQTEAHLEAEVMMNMWQGGGSNPFDAIRALRELRKRRNGETAVEVAKRIITSDKAQVDVLDYAAELLAWKEGEASVGYLVEAMQNNPKKWAIFAAALVVSVKKNKVLCDTVVSALTSVRDSGRISDIVLINHKIKTFERCQYDPGNSHSPGEH